MSSTKIGIQNTKNPREEKCCVIAMCYTSSQGNKKSEVQQGCLQKKNIEYRKVLINRKGEQRNPRKLLENVKLFFTGYSNKTKYIEG
jgi:hypothetical protein